MTAVKQRVENSFYRVAPSAVLGVCMDNILCPKCGSRSTNVTYPRHPWLLRKADEVLVCLTCGTRVYGTEQVAVLRKAAAEHIIRQEARAASDRAEAKAAAEAERAAKQELRLAEEELRLKREAARLASREAASPSVVELDPAARLKCQWPTCANAPTPSSKYCSRTCNNKNAHAKEKARKAAAKELHLA